MCEEPTVVDGQITGTVTCRWREDSQVVIDIKEIAGAEGRVIRVVLLPDGSWIMKELAE